jgi:hypothetical protein
MPSVYPIPDSKKFRNYMAHSIVEGEKSVENSCSENSG